MRASIGLGPSRLDTVCTPPILTIRGCGPRILAVLNLKAAISDQGGTSPFSVGYAQRLRHNTHATRMSATVCPSSPLLPRQSVKYLG